MRFSHIRALLAAAILLAACDSADPTSIVDPPPTPAVLLKDVVIPNLPSPYYHFEYDAGGRVSDMSFASGLLNYHLAYAGTRLDAMVNSLGPSNRRLEYVYDEAGRIGLVKYISGEEVLTLYSFTYDGPRLTGIAREVHMPEGFLRDLTIAFTYDASGNLRTLTDHRLAIEGFQTAATGVLTFEDYDSGVNVDAFMLLHNDFFDQKVLLPGIQLQHGNPRRVTRTGDGVNFVLLNEYVYDSLGRPIEKRGDLTLTGIDDGATFKLQTSYTYY